MKNYIVYTDSGIYHVFAKSKEAAKDAVYKLTFGRVLPSEMSVEVRG